MTTKLDRLREYVSSAQKGPPPGMVYNDCDIVFKDFVQDYEEIITDLVAAALAEAEARVRELEAVAERDEKVIAAAQRLISSKKRLVSQAGVGTDCVTLAAFGEWSEDETALDAALAARDAK